MVMKLNLTNAVALDFDWAERMIYWSDVTSSVSKIMRMFDNGTGEQVCIFVQEEFYYMNKHTKLSKKCNISEQQ